MKIRTIGIFLILIPSIAFADDSNISGWFDPPAESGKAFEFVYGKDVVIIGENLTGKLDSKHNIPVNRQLCFVDEMNQNDKRCYKQTDKIIKNWSPNNITFSIPDDLFGAGTTLVNFERYERSCTSNLLKGSQLCDDVLKWGDEKIINTYKLSPIINQVSSDVGLANSIAPDYTYEIKGTWFGTAKANVVIGYTKLPQSSILSWLPNSIKFNSGKLFGTTVRVQNGSSQSSVFDLTLQKTEGIPRTSSNVSSVNSSSSAQNLVNSKFSDVGLDSYAAKEISDLYARGIIQGYSDGTFKPSNTVNRAELLKLLIAGLHAKEDKGEKKCFPDVSDEWFSTFVCAAKRLGWVGGYSSGQFKPANTVNRAEAIKMIVSSLATNLDSSAILPIDVPEDSWFAPYVRKAVDLGIVIETSFKPTEVLTRADAAVWIYRGTSK